MEPRSLGRHRDLLRVSVNHHQSSVNTVKRLNFVIQLQYGGKQFNANWCLSEE